MKRLVAMLQQGCGELQLISFRVREELFRAFTYARNDLLCFDVDEREVLAERSDEPRTSLAPDFVVLASKSS